MAFIENPESIEDFQNNVLEYQKQISTLKEEIDSLNSKNSEYSENISRLENDLKNSRDLVTQYAHKVVSGFISDKHSEETKVEDITLDDIAKNLF